MSTTDLTIPTSSPSVSIRLLDEGDLEAADRTMRIAFGTHLGLPEPERFMGNADYVRTRWRANPHQAFAAELDGEVAGSNFATVWGTLGFFGPLTIRPELWGRGIGSRLMEPILDCFERCGVRHAGLFTFAESAKHLGLYQKFNFWPRFLTAIMSKPVKPKMKTLTPWTRHSEAAPQVRAEILAECRRLTDQIFEGLDLTTEIQSVASQGLGDTVLLWEGDELSGFAVCHTGPGSEAGTGNCYIKFGAVRPGPSAHENFSRLLDVCEDFAEAEHLTRVQCGINTARHLAYRHMLQSGYRTDLQGIAMERANGQGYNGPETLVIDDWR